MTQTPSLVDELKLAREVLEPATARSIRRAAGVSQERLADELGVDRTTLTRWETGATQPRGESRQRYVGLLLELRDLAS